MPRAKKIKRNKKIAYVSLGTIGVLALVYFVSFSPYALWPWAETPAATPNSSFKLISSIDGEDVSNFVEVSVWIPDDGEEFEDISDIYTWSNFEEEESSKDADDVSINLADYSYVWLEIDPDGETIFANNHHLLTPGGKNNAYVYEVFHQSSDVNFLCMDNTSSTAWLNFSSAVTTHNVPYGLDDEGVIAPPSTFAADAIGENMTLVMNVPEYTHANIHSGSNWAVEESEYDDMSTAELEFHHDEANWRSQAPVYVPADDLEKTGGAGLESVTNAFCIRWTYNTTVSTADAATTQINMTITDNTQAEVVIDGVYIYMIFYGEVNFDYGSFIVEFEYEEGHRIYATTVQSGRILVPRGTQSLGAFTAYSTVGL